MKSIFITGINRGLGKELFNQCIAKGYIVYGLLKNEEAYKELCISVPSTAILILVDIASDDSIEKIRSIVQDSCIDLLINNAGTGGTGYTIDTIESQELLNLFNIHCVGAFRVVQALHNNLLKSEHATVINMSSRLGSILNQSNGTYNNLTVSYAYRIAKAAQNMLTNCLKNELGAHITFVSLHPGKLKTPIGQSDAEIEPSIAAQQIIEHWESNTLKEADGIVELPDNLIGW
ncbi:MAG: SDR family NAD(P)-dependent oxidoreductase [Cytophagales bacterium]|nr:SDR family NAD(P)-dependent oxidoreductase [Cytophaga sp.]